MASRRGKAVDATGALSHIGPTYIRRRMDCDTGAQKDTGRAVGPPRVLNPWPATAAAAGTIASAYFWP
jgi:hypothetical protein